VSKLVVRSIEIFWRSSVFIKNTLFSFYGSVCYELQQYGNKISVQLAGFYYYLLEQQKSSKPHKKQNHT
jgi:hypothetical protein